MNLLRPAGFFLCGLLASPAMAQSPGPTDPAGPRLEPPSLPRIGTETGVPAMDEQIERGTLIDRKEVLKEDMDQPATSPTGPGTTRQPAAPLGTE